MHFRYIVHNSLFKKDKKQIYYALKCIKYSEGSSELLTLSYELFISLHYTAENQPITRNESDNIQLLIKHFKSVSLFKILKDLCNYLN